MSTGTDLDQRSINTIRFLSVDAVQKANSGHPGLPMGAAPMAYVLWMRHMKYNPTDPGWWDRDRFLLSAGHGSMLLYSLLHLTGYDLPMEQIKLFRQVDSMTPGHPERGLAPGVETTTGPLGQGFGNGIGMAIAERYLAARYNRPGHEIINHYTYAIVSDGDLMEGISHEAASLAGHLKLGKLIYLYDNNHISLASSTDLTYTEDREMRFQAYGWHVQTVSDGNDLDAIDAAIRAAKAETERPSLIMVRTIIGYGAPHKQNTFQVHGSPLGPDEVQAAKTNLGWPLEPTFLVPDDVGKNMRQAIEKGKQAEDEWSRRFDAYRREFPDLAQELERALRHELPAGWNKDVPSFPADMAKGMATRSASGQVLNCIAPYLPNLIGGSADLNPSTDTALKKMGDFQPEQEAGEDTQGAVGGGFSYAGRNLHFGVREHAMGAAANGMAAHEGIMPFTATFLTFSDYMRPAIRLAAIMQVHVIFVFTHDSIGLGEDGPTHQPIGQLASLRAIPQLTVIRPSDANEVAVAWQVAIETKGPVVLVFTRQVVPVLDRTQYAPADGVRRGAYVLAEAPGGKPDVVLIASGSEVALITGAQQKLAEQGIQARLVSMPSWELFDAQPQSYRDSVLPPDLRARVAVEAGVPLGWYKYVGTEGAVIGLERYGLSGPYKQVFEELGYTVDNVIEQAKRVLNR